MIFLFQVYYSKPILKLAIKVFFFEYLPEDDKNFQILGVLPQVCISLYLITMQLLV
jgi:hypothetical protein